LPFASFHFLWAQEQFGWSGRDKNHCENNLFAQFLISHLGQVYSRPSKLLDKAEKSAKKTVAPLQRVQNAAARVISRTRKRVKETQASPGTFRLCFILCTGYQSNNVSNTND
jgi:hypothetical protein